MKIIKFTSCASRWPFLRQTPGGNGVWEGFKFVTNDDVDMCDGWVIYDDVPKPMSVTCPKSKVLLIAGEAPQIKRYPRAFLAQHSVVLTCQSEIHHPNVIRSQLGLAWFTGIKDGSTAVKGYDDFLKDQFCSKSFDLSVVCSNKCFKRCHRDRLRFVKYLQSHFKSRLHAFGRGFNEVNDKAEALSSYRYHIALENCAHPDWWTEKLADAYLEGTFPFYFGAPNIDQYFSRDSYIPISIYDEREAVRLIERAMDEDVFSKRQEALLAAKNLVLMKYNLFAQLAKLLAAQPDSESTCVTIRPQAQFQSMVRSIGKAAKRLLLGPNR